MPVSFQENDCKAWTCEVLKKELKVQLNLSGSAVLKQVSCEEAICDETFRVIEAKAERTEAEEGAVAMGRV